MDKTDPARPQAVRTRRPGNRCWKDDEPMPGKKPGTGGDCKPKHK